MLTGWPGGAPLVDSFFGGAGSTVDIPTVPFTGHPLFDWAASVVILFGLISLVLAWIFNTVSKS